MSEKMDQINRIGYRGIAAQATIVVVTFGLLGASIVWSGQDWGLAAWLLVVGSLAGRLSESAEQRTHRQLAELEDKDKRTSSGAVPCARGLRRPSPAPEARPDLEPDPRPEERPPA